MNASASFQSGDSKETPSRFSSLAKKFEADWESGLRPRIEDYLTPLSSEPDNASEVPLEADVATLDIDSTYVKPVRQEMAELFSQLLKIEVEMRREQGEDVDIGYYSARFPDFVETVTLLFQPRLVDSKSSNSDSANTLAANTLVGDGAQSASSSEQMFQTASMYQVRRTVGQGAFGSVHLAVEQSLDRQVALKELQGRHASRPEVTSRFVREAEITGSLEHPGIVPIYGMGHSDGRPFYTMRLIDGDNLHDSIKRFHENDQSDSGKRNLELRNLLRRFVDVCNTVEYAHSRGVLHRDLKPANVMLGGYGETLVVDWGLAKVLGAESSSLSTDEQSETAGSVEEAVDISMDQTLPTPLSSGRSASVPAGSDVQSYQGMVVGTPSYMSPEQAAGDVSQLDSKSDVYSLGAILYVILCNRTPVSGDTLSTVLEKVQQADFPRPREVSPHVPRALEAVCLKAMAPTPNDRYASARLLADDVEHWLADEPIACYQETLVERSARWIRRHRSWTVSGAAALLLIAAVSIVAAVWVNKARLEAENAKGEAVAAQGQEKLARQQEVNARRQAEDNFQMAWGAVNDVLTSAGVDRDIQSQGLEPFQKKVLSQAKNYFERFVKLYPDNTNLLMERGRAYWRLAKLHHMLGESEEAEKAYLDSAKVWRQLSERPADVQPTSEDRLAPQPRISESNTSVIVRTTNNLGETECLERLASCHVDLGLLYNQIGRINKSVKVLEEGLAIRKKLAADHPELRRLRNDLAQAHHFLGVSYQATGRVEEASEALQAALAIRQKLAEKYPEAQRYQDALAMVLNSIASTYSQTGETDKGMADYQKALKIRRELVRKNPKLTENRTMLADCLYNIGIEHWQARRLDEAFVVYQEALTIRAGLAEEHPKIPQYQYRLSASHNNLGIVYNLMGRKQDAVQALLTALDIRRRLTMEYPTSLTYQDAFADTYIHLGFVYRSLGKVKDASAAYRSALAIRQKLAADCPDVIQYQDSLADCQTGLGSFYHHVSRTEDALAAFQAALKIRESLAEKQPTTLEYQDDLADCNNAVGVTYSDAGRAEEAMNALQASLKIRQKLAKDFPQAARWRDQLADSHNSIGVVCQRAKRMPEALAAFQASLEIRKQLVKEHAKVPEYHDALAASHYNLGLFYSEAGQIQQAIAMQQAALDVRKKLVEEHSNTPKYQAGLAKVYHDLAVAHSRATPNSPQTLTAFEAAMAIRQTLAEQQPETVQYQMEFAHSQAVLGPVYFAAGRPDDALAMFESALKIRRGIAEKHLALQHQAYLAKALDDLGVLYRMRKRDEQALATFQESLKVRQHLVQQRPEVVGYQRDLASGYVNLGNLLKAAGRFRESLDFFQRGHDLGSKLQNWKLPTERWVENGERLAALEDKLTELQKDASLPVEAKEQIALAHEICRPKKQYAQAVELCRKAFASEPKLANAYPNRYNAACAAALAGAGKGDAAALEAETLTAFLAQAIQWLTQDVKGLAALLKHEDPKARNFARAQLQHWQKDTDLEPLRDAASLTKLSDDKRTACENLWKAVTDALAGAD